MPALADRYRQEIIQAALEVESDDLKAAVFSSTEMTEAFSCFMKDKDVAIKYCFPAMIEMKLGKWEFVTDDEDEADWMMPFVRKASFSFTFDFYEGLVESLIDSKKLEKLDLTSVSDLFFDQDELWDLACVTPHVCLYFEMLVSAPSKFGKTPAMNTLEISFSESSAFDEPPSDDNDQDLSDSLVNTFRAPTRAKLNVPNLVFNLIGSEFTIDEFVSALKAAGKPLHKTRNLSLKLPLNQDDDSAFLSLLFCVRRIAPKLKTINLHLFDETFNCPAKTSATELWEETIAWRTDFGKMLCDHAPTDVKVVVRLSLSAYKFKVTPADLQTFSKPGIDVSRRYEDVFYEEDVCITSVKNTQTQVSPKIDIQACVEFRLM